MRLTIENGTVFTPDNELPGYTLVIETGRITSLKPKPDTDIEKGELVDATGMYVIPGMIDLHVHGAVGHDVMDASPIALQNMARFFASHGVTSYLPTTVTAPSIAIKKAIDNIAHTAQSKDGAQHLGVHLEGPFINKDYKGAQLSEYIRDPNLEEFEQYIASGIIKLVTLAPEQPEALSLIERGVKEGIRFAVGHSGANYDQIIQSVERGLSQATHTFNGMASLHHREPGVIGGVLTEDRIWAELICDGIHVHPAVVNLVVRSKGTHRTILITDAIRATGLGDGIYNYLGEKIIVNQSIARNTDGHLAGSTTTMDEELRTIMDYCNLSLSQALPMVTSTPANAIGLGVSKGVIAPGADADVVLLDANYRVRMTIVSGRIVYKN
jgi:N-acetylglucosamine-6-phosphate deacetylase